MRYDDRDLSVLAMERVPATLHGVVHELLQGPLTAPAHRTRVGLVSAFFALVARAARDLRYSVRDLHWDNLGVTSTAPAPAVVFIDFERCSYAEGLSEKARCRGGVRSWLNSLRDTAAPLPTDHAWKGAIAELGQRVPAWWQTFGHALPAAADILQLEQACCGSVAAVAATLHSAVGAGLPVDGPAEDAPLSLPPAVASNAPMGGGAVSGLTSPSAAAETLPGRGTPQSPAGTAAPAAWDAVAEDASITRSSGAGRQRSSGGVPGQTMWEPSAASPAAALAAAGVGSHGCAQGTDRLASVTDTHTMPQATTLASHCSPWPYAATPSPQDSPWLPGAPAAGSGNFDAALLLRCLATLNGGVQPPPAYTLYRVGVWRNPATAPLSNPRSIPLQTRLASGQPGEWHPNHHAPAHARSLLDHCSALLRALFVALPRSRITVPTRTSQCIEAFVRKYGAKLCAQAKAMDPRSTDGTLTPETALELVRAWVRTQSCPQHKGVFVYGPTALRNQFQWAGFYFADEEELRQCTSDAWCTWLCACEEWAAGSATSAVVMPSSGVPVL